jgi:hypothetical protein
MMNRAGKSRKTSRFVPRRSVAHNAKTAKTFHFVANVACLAAPAERMALLADFGTDFGVPKVPFIVLLR